jgi:hypothetical protein
VGSVQVTDLARTYRESRLRRGVPSPHELVDALATRYRTRRWHRLEAIVARINGLPDAGAAPDPSASEALEYANRQADPSAPRDMATLLRWRAACFDVLVRDALNAGERVADLRLRPGQRAVLVPTTDSTTLGVTASSTAPWTGQQQRALDDLARVRDTVAAGHPLDIAMAPLPQGDEWHELTTQLGSRRSWRTAARNPE